MKRKILSLFIGLSVWWLVADGYWMSKERSVQQCMIGLLEAMSSDPKEFHDRYSKFDGYTSFDRWTLCSKTEGGGVNWYLTSGMAAWEMIVLLPVVNRWIWK